MAASGLIESMIWPPALLFMAGAVVVPFLGGRLKKIFLIGLPVVAFYLVHHLPDGDYGTAVFMDWHVVLFKLDALSRVFTYIFLLAAGIGFIYAWNVNDDVQYTSALCYAGGALGVTLAGDWLSLYLFWEVMAIASTFLILARRTAASRAAGYRYVLVHVVGGLSLLAGIVLLGHDQGHLAISAMPLEGPAAWLMFIGIGLNAAVPPMHAWLKDAYPEATVAGAVFLSAFTTKSAVYVMARTFPGTELLIWLGAFMTVLPVFYAEVENDIRRVLSYSLMNQVGFMLCGIGIGSAMAINGAVSHAFCHILYKALLFMAAGSVLHVTGKIACTEIGGLYRTMPITCCLCIVGAASISAFPLFSGFVSKSMIITAAGENHRVWAWVMLQFASAGVIAHAGIKVPFFTFFGHDSGIRAHEPPTNMLLAMGVAAILCIGIGVYPQPLYAILPYPVDYIPYTGAHVVGQLQLLLFAIFAFYLLLKSGYYPSEVRALNLDTDWIYRKGGRWIYRLLDRVLNGINRWSDQRFRESVLQPGVTFAAEAGTRLALVALAPLAAIGLVGDRYPGRLARAVRAAMASGSVPVGVGALVAGAVLVALYWVGS